MSVALNEMAAGRSKRGVVKIIRARTPGPVPRLLTENLQTPDIFGSTSDETTSDRQCLESSNMNARIDIEAWKPTARMDRAGVKIKVGNALVDGRTGRVERGGSIQRLRAKELELLLHLYQHSTMTFTRQQLLQDVWNFAATLVTRTVDQTVATLRKKIESHPDQPQFLQTVYGVGYRLVL